VQLQWTDVAVGDVINAVHVETEPSSAVLSVIETPVAALWDEFAFPPPAASETEEPPVEEASKPQPPPSLDDIRRLAYLLWERNGRPDDSDRHFWTLAEKLLTPGEPDVIPFRPLSDAEPPADVAAPAPKAAIG